jgi:hypothetical protein
MGVFSHQHIQTGEKMSLPACFGKAVQLNHADVPWPVALFRQACRGCDESALRACNLLPMANQDDAAVDLP